MKKAMISPARGTGDLKTGKVVAIDSAIAAAMAASLRTPNPNQSSTLARKAQNGPKERSMYA